MRCYQMLAALPLLLSLLSHPAAAEDRDNEAIATVRKAATFFEVTGVAPVTPTRLFITVETFAEGTDRAQLREQCRQNYEVLQKALVSAGVHDAQGSFAKPEFRVLLRVGNGYQTLDSIDTTGRPGDVYKIVLPLYFEPKAIGELRSAFAAMRASGVPGQVKVEFSLKDDKAARLAALKSAVMQARQQSQILGEAAKPKTLELVYMKQGEFSSPYFMNLYDLQGARPLNVPDGLEAEAKVAFFYGLKPATVQSAAKPTKKPALASRLTAKK